MSTLELENGRALKNLDAGYYTGLALSYHLKGDEKRATINWSIAKLIVKLKINRL